MPVDQRQTPTATHDGDRLRRPLVVAIAAAVAACGGLIYIARAQYRKPHPTVAAEPASVPTISAGVDTRATAETPAVRTLCDRTLPGAMRLRANIETLAPARLPNADVAALETVLCDTGDDTAIRNTAINLLRKRSTAPLPDLLVRQATIPSENPAFLAFIAQHLGLCLRDQPQRGDVIEALRALLNHDDPRVRAEALWPLTLARDERAMSEAHSGLTNTKWASSRALIIRCQVSLDWKGDVARVRALAAQQGDASARVEAIRALAHWRDTDSRALFEDAKASPNADVRTAAQAALISLAADSPK